MKTHLSKRDARSKSSQRKALVPRVRFHSIERAIEKVYTHVATQSRHWSRVGFACWEWTRTQSREAIQSRISFSSLSGWSFGLCKCTWNSSRLADGRSHLCGALHSGIYHVSGGRTNALNCKHAQLTIRHCVCRRVQYTPHCPYYQSIIFMKEEPAGDVPLLADYTRLKNGNAEWKMHDFLAAAWKKHARQTLQAAAMWPAF